MPCMPFIPSFPCVTCMCPCSLRPLRVHMPPPRREPGSSRPGLVCPCLGHMLRAEVLSAVDGMSHVPSSGPGAELEAPLCCASSPKLSVCQGIFLFTAFGI